MNWPVIILAVILLIMIFSPDEAEGFSLSRKPMEHDWDRLHRNPFDEVDYQTPRFIVG